MPLFIFARFHVRAECESAAEAALRDVLGPTRKESSCLSIHAFRSLRDPRLFYIHSRWSDEAAFEVHALMPHTVNFIERMQAIVDHPLEVIRTELID